MPKRLVILLALTVVNTTVLVVLLASNATGPDPADAGPAADIVRVANTASHPALDFKKDIAPFFAKYCFDCHGPDKQKGEIALHKFDTKQSVIRNRQVWQKVLKMLGSRQMPPKKRPQPTEDQRLAITDWVRATLDEIDCSGPRDPGRVTIRRLNKSEYNNTVRDLFDIRFTPADDFPDDDVGYGFDNIGDVLSLPPVLMEKYLAAAEQVTQKAIEAEAKRAEKAEALRFTASELQGGDYDRRTNTRVLNTEGSVSAYAVIPADGVYVLRVTAFGLQAGDEPAKMELTIDNRDSTMRRFDVKAERSNPGTYELRVSVDKGKHVVTIAFLNDYSNPNAPDPAQRDRDLIIQRLAIEGPAGQKKRGDDYLRIFVSRPSGNDVADWRNSAQIILRRLARRAFRRPVTDDEANRLVKFVELAKQQGASFEAGVELAMQAMLVSPHFLFRVELDPPADDPDNIRTLNDHELAVRLSYFLWSSMPDQELFDLAERNKLHEPALMRQQVRRMLNDRKAGALVENFTGQWLQLRSLDRHEPDPDLFPDYDKLRDAMRLETEMFFQTVMREDRSILDFIDGRFTFVNERLANYYGIKGVKGDHFRRVSLDGTQRSGVITQASILTITSNPTRTNPVKRGKFVLEEILGTPPPAPPPNVPQLEETAKLEGTLRQRMEKHRESPICASCHARLDPIGFGLENFDAVGRWRTRDAGHPIDASGKLPDGDSFNGPAGLKSMLLSKKQLFARAFSEKMLTYALGRGLEYFDQCTVNDLVDALKADQYRFTSLIQAIVQSDAFRKRRGPRGDNDDE